jgi:hypothetical protein
MMDKQFLGRVESVNNQEHQITVGSLLRHRTFDLGAHCAIIRWDGAAGMANDLRPGQKVTIRYQNAQGVLAADRVEQNAMRFHGMVKTVDLNRRLMTLHAWDRDRRFVLGEDCKVVLHDGEKGALENIKPGDHVAVVYESPSDADIAREVIRPSESFTGSIVAVDLPRRTVSVKDMFGVKQFSLGNRCSIVMNGRTDAPLMDVRLRDRLTILYDEVNGVNVANRIAPAENTREADTALTNP